MKFVTLRYSLALGPDGEYRVLTDDVIAPELDLVRPHPVDDVASVQVDLSLAVVLISFLPLPGEERDELLGRLGWRLRTQRACT